jgi:hypothetical protein
LWVVVMVVGARVVVVVELVISLNRNSFLLPPNFSGYPQHDSTS